MHPNGSLQTARDLMEDFARETGLSPLADRPRRYLWTDAFAVCNYLGLYEKTGAVACRERALALIGQVHDVLGRYRNDDLRAGWISGLSSAEGKRHPTAGGLRIGKPLPERGFGDLYDERREWDRDGQYFHYLTKWMHALCRAAGVTGNPDFLTWAVELARISHARFAYLPPGGRRKRMYWKMSTDLKRPLVGSMGLHDPLDAFLTYSGLRYAAVRDHGRGGPVLDREISEAKEICRGTGLVTDDPLGIGGLLADASRLSRMTAGGGPAYPRLLENILGAAATGLASFAGSGSLRLPAGHRLAFRELGLSIGLSGMEAVRERIERNPQVFGRQESLPGQVNAVIGYLPLKETIEGFWLDDKNRRAPSWTGHRAINTVMLATSLEPAGFLGS
jgi:hypothetical protein